MNNIARLPFELSVQISRTRLKPHRGTGIVEYDWSGRVLPPTGRSDGDCGALRLPTPAGRIRKRRAASLSSYGYYANLIVGRLRQLDGGEPN